MLQALLADRFQLKLHPETRELAALAVIVGKNGPKLTKAKADAEALIGNDKPGKLTAQNQSIAGLIAFIGPYLSGPSRTPILDRTGLNDKFDFTLEWSLDASVAATVDNAATTPGASIFTALEEQLGLKVESTKAPFPVLIIESVQRPSEN